MPIYQVTANGDPTGKRSPAVRATEHTRDPGRPADGRRWWVVTATTTRHRLGKHAWKRQGDGKNLNSGIQSNPDCICRFPTNQAGAFRDQTDTQKDNRGVSRIHHRIGNQLDSLLMRHTHTYRREISTIQPTRAHASSKLSCSFALHTPFALLSLATAGGEEATKLEVETGKGTKRKEVGWGGWKLQGG